MRKESSASVCDPEIFQNGQPVLCIDGRSANVEKWVRTVAKKTGARLDWHYSGGVAQVLFLGDDEGRVGVEKAIHELSPKLDGRILRRFEKGDAGLYRRGVSSVPEGTIAGFYDGGSESVFIREE